MLLQTNSYIVPKDKRVEHSRLLRRFRQALARLGCDHFEAFEQVGSNWTGETTSRFVQIMRFRDRKHQQQVQLAERADPAAQTLIREFCELINFPYQQQQGFFAVGFYTSALPIAPLRHFSNAPPAEAEPDAVPETLSAPAAAGGGSMLSGLSGQDWAQDAPAPTPAAEEPPADDASPHDSVAERFPEPRQPGQLDAAESPTSHLDAAASESVDEAHAEESPAEEAPAEETAAGERTGPDDWSAVSEEGRPGDTNHVGDRSGEGDTGSEGDTSTGALPESEEQSEDQLASDEQPPAEEPSSEEGFINADEDDTDESDETLDDDVPFDLLRDSGEASDTNNTDEAENERGRAWR